MKILHTSDWHLGKNLEGYSRLPEQEQFLEELIEIVEREEIDLLLIAGDIYDHYNPPAMAEQLFYKSMKRLSKGGERAIIVIAGNHDQPDRLTAARSLAYEQGIVLLGRPKSIAQEGSYKGFEITEAGEGYLKLAIKGEKAVILTLPYPSEKRLNELMSIQADEETMQASYSERIGQLFSQLSQHFSQDTINLAMSHLYMVGGEQTDSERQIQLGGSMAVEADLLPPAQYIALGHLHRPQAVKGGGKKAFYSGSPLQYSKSEINYSKCVYKIELEAGQEEAQVQAIYLKNYKPIEIWKCSGIEEAIALCQERAEENLWVYLEIETDRVLTSDEIKTLRDIRKDIVEIRPILMKEESSDQEIENLTELNMMEVFHSFYLENRGVDPSPELLEMFGKIIGQEGEEYETVTTED